MAKMLSFYTNLGESLSFIRKFFLVKQPFHGRKIFSSKQDESGGHKGEKKNSVTVTETSLCRRNWDKLDRDVMELIIMRLNPRDTIRLKNVCKSWRSLLLQNQIRKYPLLVLPHVGYSEHLSCVCLFDGTILNIKLPKSMEDCLYCGSSKGWLFMAEVALVGFNLRRFKPICEFYIYMFNPDSGKMLELPPLSTILLREGEIRDVDKIELSSPDTLNCVVAATFSVSGSANFQMAMCKPESKQWTVFDRYDFGCVDILFLNGELCVLCISENHHVRCCTFEVTNGEEVNMRIIPLGLEPLPRLLNLIHNQFGIVTNSASNIYLAESTNGELLLIRRFYDEFVFVQEGHHELEDIQEGHEELDDMQEGHEEIEEGGIDEPDHPEEDIEDFEDPEELPEGLEFECRKTTKFDVYRVDLDTGNLSKLKNLGEQVIFVHRGGSPIVCTGSCLATESNCIYFTEDAGCSISKWKSREIGFYKLGDGRICRCFPSVPNPKFSMGWLTIETHSNSPFN